MRALILRLSAASLALIELIALLSIGTLARADNAGFALAPKGAVFAVDARGVADLLEGDRGALVRLGLGRVVLRPDDAGQRRGHADHRAVGRRAAGHRRLLGLVGRLCSKPAPARAGLGPARRAV